MPRVGMGGIPATSNSGTWSDGPVGIRSRLSEAPVSPSFNKRSVGADEGKAQDENGADDGWDEDSPVGTRRFGSVAGTGIAAWVVVFRAGAYALSSMTALLRGQMPVRRNAL